MVRGCQLPSSTAREERRPAIELEKAWRESWHGISAYCSIGSNRKDLSYVDLIPR